MPRKWPSHVGTGADAGVVLAVAGIPDEVQRFDGPVAAVEGGELGGSAVFGSVASLGPSGRVVSGGTRERESAF
jgi:hypothetical protein